MPGEIDPNTRLTRRGVAAALTEHGFPISDKTLATRASRPGRAGGPPYYVFSGKALYPWGEALAWAQNQKSAIRRNTSEIHVQAA